MNLGKRKPGRPPVPKDKQGRMVWIPGKLWAKFKAWMDEQKENGK